MSAQTDALASDVDQVVNVLASVPAFLQASAEAEAKWQAHLAGDAVDQEAVTNATHKLATAREGWNSTGTVTVLCRKGQV